MVLFGGSDFLFPSTLMLDRMVGVLIMFLISSIRVFLWAEYQTGDIGASTEFLQHNAQFRPCKHFWRLTWYVGSQIGFWRSGGLIRICRLYNCTMYIDERNRKESHLWHTFHSCSWRDHFESSRFRSGSRRLNQKVSRKPDWIWRAKIPVVQRKKFPGVVLHSTSTWIQYFQTPNETL